MHGSRQSQATAARPIERCPLSIVASGRNRRKKWRPDDDVKAAGGSSVGTQIVIADRDSIRACLKSLTPHMPIELPPAFRDGLQLRHEIKERMLAIGPYLSNTGLP
jgi:hypothetical protein